MKLKRLSEEGLNKLEIKWLGLLGNDVDGVIKADYNQLFNIIKATGWWGGIKESYNKPLYSCVIDSDNKEWGIVEIVLSQNGNSIWVKILDIHLSPEIEIVDDTEESTKSRLRVFKAALTGTFDLTKDVIKADTVKVFGRTDVLVAFLRGMHESFSVLATLGTISGITVSIEGRWLVFRTK